MYDLPPLDLAQFNNPPTYPEEKATLPSQQKSSNTQPVGGAGPSGGRGPGGASMGGPGMGGVGMGGAPGMGGGPGGIGGQRY